MQFKSCFFKCPSLLTLMAWNTHKRRRNFSIRNRKEKEKKNEGKSTVLIGGGQFSGPMAKALRF